MDQFSYSLNRKDLNNFKQGKLEIHALIPGINSGIVMNPNYSRERKFYKGIGDNFLSKRS